MDKIIIEANEDQTKAVVKYLNEETNTYDRQEVYKTTDKNFIEIARKYYEEKKQTNPYYPHTIVEEHEAKNGKGLKAAAIAAFGVLGVAAVLGIGGCYHYKTQLDEKNASSASANTSVELSIDEEEKEEIKDTPDNTNDIPDNEEPKLEETKAEEVQTKTIEELNSDSRYTEVTEENITSGTQQFMMDMANNGVDLDGAEALTFATVGNITHADHTNPDLNAQVFGSYPDKETVMSKTGHIIGQIATLKIVKGVDVDWTAIFVDETDRKIALHAKQTIDMCTEIAKNSELSEEEKAKQIQSLIQERFVKPNYDKSVGYEYNGEKISKSQEDGADFITDAIFTGIIMGDNTLKNYVYGSETMDDMLAIAGNEDVVSNMHTIIENCQSKVR